jgi:kumamolisin
MITTAERRALRPGGPGCSRAELKQPTIDVEPPILAVSGDESQVVPDARFVPLPGSVRTALPWDGAAGLVDTSERIEVTLITRRRAELPHDLGSGKSVITRDELSARYGADPADLELIGEVLARYGLEVVNVDVAGRRVTVTGTIARLEETFGASLRLVTTLHSMAGSAMVSHRYREGALRLPAELGGIVLAVLGLDDRPQARPHARRVDDGAVHRMYTPSQVADIYQFPAGTDGSGQTLAFIELGGGFSQSDLDLYFAGLGLSPPSVTAISVDGAINIPGRDQFGAGAEVVPGIEIGGAVAPGAAQLVYFAPNTDRGFVDAVTTAVHAAPTPTAVAISWGQPEGSWTAQARAALDEIFADAAALGATVCVSAGNNGSNDGIVDGLPHVNFPASSPRVLACGGTTLHADPVTGAIMSETVWNDSLSGGATGGGVSDVFPLPSWQANAGVPARAGTGNSGRGVPDVAGNADPATGYQVLINGESAVVGGTSAVAALWAALTCRVAQASGRPLGAIQQRLYAGVNPGTSTPGFRSITTGNNGAYSAGPGWDACTGLGSPDGLSLCALLADMEFSPPVGKTVPAAPPEASTGEMAAVRDSWKLPAEPGPVVDDDVRFTVYRPEVMCPGRWASLLVFAHKTSPVVEPGREPVDPLEVVEARARAHLDRTPIGPVGVDAQQGLPRGAHLRIVPELPGIRCNPREAGIEWWEPVHEVVFRLVAGPDLAGTVVRGAVRVWCGPLIFGEVSIAIRIAAGDPGAEAPPVMVPVLPYRKIFPSYSHRDRAVVENFAAAARALGDRYLQDVLALRAGERWDARLLELIEDADVFQLFWSRNSMHSPHCRQEWEHALALRRPLFVRPVYWEEPLPADPNQKLPPAPLRALHFVKVPVVKPDIRYSTAAPAPPTLTLTAPSPGASMSANRRRTRPRRLPVRVALIISVLLVVLAAAAVLILHAVGR